MKQSNVIYTAAFKTGQNSNQSALRMIEMV